ncbi:SRPBCC family protein [Halorhodospira halophila]|uniref:Cyclase/dehydrase n=1 Tax=Halorhodospira halophila (strain DSM 244 / SL1) TaxID=349124 RepID=A1WU08_HALHL|nr:SRPBCC family protein [Halorhodospira halophila]ABM61170.1 cyclase/dehydrase [Halorhodospira halophila SL1]
MDDRRSSPRRSIGGRRTSRLGAIGHTALVAALSLLIAPPIGAAEILERDFEVRRPDFELRVVARLDAPREAVWAVLTDYERLAELSPGLLESRIIANDEAREILVATVTEGCLLLFCRKVQRVEAMEEDPPGRIRARILPEHSDLRHGVTDWLLEDHGEATHVTVHARLRPDFWVPPGIGPRQMQRTFMRDMTELMERVETEARSARRSETSGAADRSPYLNRS